MPKHRIEPEKESNEFIDLLVGEALHPVGRVGFLVRVGMHVSENDLDAMSHFEDAGLAALDRKRAWGVLSCMHTWGRRAI